jgi:hypothetical protein
MLEKVIISNGILSGKIDTMGNYYYIKNRVHIYLTSDSVMKINTGYILSIPLDGIAKVKKAKFEVGETIILVVVCASLFILGILWIREINKPFLL